MHSRVKEGGEERAWGSRVKEGGEERAWGRGNRNS